MSRFSRSRLGETDGGQSLPDHRRRIHLTISKPISRYAAVDLPFISANGTHLGAKDPPDRRADGQAYEYSPDGLGLPLQWIRTRSTLAPGREAE